MRKLAISGAVAALAAAAAAPAHAAVPFNAGTGHDAQVAVGGDGTGHVVWLTQETGDRVGYCRVPKNGTACNVSRLFSFPNGAAAFSTGDVPQVFAPATNKVVVIGSCFICGAGGATDRIFRWISSDNGATFGPPSEIANHLSPGGQGAYVNAGNVFIGVEGRELLAAPTSLVTTPIRPLPSGYVYSPSVVRVPGQNQLVAASSNLSAVAYAVFSGTLTPGSINNLANWSAPLAPPGGPADDDETALGAGGAGTFLVYKRFVPNDNRVIVHRYAPGSRTFGAPAAIEGPSPVDDRSADYTDIAVDNAGPHVIWRTLYDDGRLRYRRSTNGGASWGPVMSIAVRDTYIEPQIAVAPGGTGFAAWTGIGTSRVRIVALRPTPRCGGQAATIVAESGVPTIGTARRDVIVGTPGADVIKALGGNDLVCAGGGRDRVVGAAGKDKLLGAKGADKLLGGRGRDRLVGGPGPDRLFGGALKDVLLGGGGKDLLVGGPGKDLLRGGPGRDRQRQ